MSSVARLIPFSLSSALSSLKRFRALSRALDSKILFSLKNLGTMRAANIILQLPVYPSFIACKPFRGFRKSLDVTVSGLLWFSEAPHVPQALCCDVCLQRRTLD